MKKFSSKVYPAKTISTKLCPRDYFNEEDNHLMEIGVKKSPGIINDVEGISVGRLYFDSKESLQETMIDLKKINVLPVVKCGLTRIVIYSPDNGTLLYYYLKGKNIDCQGIFRYQQQKTKP